MDQRRIDRSYIRYWFMNFDFELCEDRIVDFWGELFEYFTHK